MIAVGRESKVIKMLSRQFFNSMIHRNRDCILRRHFSYFKPMKDVASHEETELDPEKPLKFSTSPAAHFNIRHIRLEPDPIGDAPWYKPVILMGTLFITIIYGMYYRQRTDIDDELEMPLGKRVLQIKEHFVMQDKNEALRNGLTTQKFEAELDEIQRLRKKYKYVDD